MNVGTCILLNSFSRAIHSRLPRAVVEFAIPANFDNSQSDQYDTGPNFDGKKVLNSHAIDRDSGVISVPLSDLFREVLKSRKDFTSKKPPFINTDQRIIGRVSLFFVHVYAK